MTQLTHEQRDLLFHVQCPVNENHPVSRAVFEQLIQMKLVYIRKDGRADLSVEGEQACRLLKKSEANVEQSRGGA